MNIPSWPNFTQEEADKVSDVLLSNKVNYWTGQEGREFEKEFANFADCDYAVAVSNGSVALDLCLHALSIGSANGGSGDDEVIVTPRTFIASISSIVLAGAKPVFADVCLDSQNITPQTCEAVLTENTKAIVAVHLAGWPCDMGGFKALSEERGIKLIEDCAQAHGAKYQGKSVGSFGDVAAWSFCQDKIMTTGGEGGMVTTNDKALWNRAWSYKDHGKSFDTVYNKEHPPGFRWLHESFGTNLRLTEMQSAIGRIQLQRMPQWHEQRKKNSEKLKQCFDQYDFLATPLPESHAEHAYYKFYTFVKPELLPEGCSRDAMIDALNEAGVPCFQGSCSEVYLEKAFDDQFRPAERLLNAKKLGETSLMFLVHPTIDDAAMDEMIVNVSTVLDKIARGKK